MQLELADVSHGEATLRTTPSSGQATKNSQLPRPKILACHSRGALAALP